MTNHENLLKYENNGLSNRLRDVSHCATRRVYKLIKIDFLSSSARQRIILPGSNVVCVHHVIQYYEKLIQQAWHRGTRLVFHAQKELVAVCVAISTLITSVHCLGAKSSHPYRSSSSKYPNTILAIISVRSVQSFSYKLPPQ